MLQLLLWRSHTTLALSLGNMLTLFFPVPLLCPLCLSELKLGCIPDIFLEFWKLSFPVPGYPSLYSNSPLSIPSFHEHKGIPGIG